ncbi:hypothetical protein G3M48_006156 [Beauveria asiatica]|uniref:CHAT domain-containing protein n=1 Tax=Beauveria asiatica TaxID=1069075 RepID=A0AAW0RQV9_9HYPO
MTEKMDIEQFATQHNIDKKDIPNLLAALAVNAYTEYQKSRGTDAINAAVELARRGISRIDGSNASFLSWQNNLGVFLESRFKQTGEMADLEEAIESNRNTVQFAQHNDPQRTSWISNLGNKLETRFECTGEMADLEEAIKMARDAFRSTPYGLPARINCLHNLGNKLSRRFECTGELADLEEAIKIARDVIQFTPYDHPGHAASLSTLGHHLGCRFDRIGDMADLEEAIERGRNAVQSTSNDHPERTGCLINLGNNLDRRYQRTGEMADLEEAIEMTRNAVQITAPSHSEYATWLSNLGNMLESRFEQEAVEIGRQAIQLTPQDHPGYVSKLLNLGNNLYHWFEHTGDMKNLEEAAEMIRNAIHLTPHGHSEYANLLSNLGTMISSRFECIGEMADLEEAATHFYDAWNCLNAISFHRVRAAGNCLRILAIQGRTEDGVRLGTAVIDFLPTVHTKTLERNDQQFVMSTFAGVAADLCSFLVASGRLEDALEYLERGRAAIISQLLDRRGDISILAKAQPTMARQYESLVNELNTPLHRLTDDELNVQATRRRREAVIELEVCTQQIRNIPGHERFLLAKTAAVMQECAANGTIIVVNITKLRSDAILVSRHGIQSIVLPEMSALEVMAWLDKDWLVRKRSEQRRKNDEFLEYLSWLWRVCVKPVLDRIGATYKHSGQDRPRVWWIGTGLASSMPFHAAGDHVSGAAQNCYERVISSYTPSIKALSYAQGQARGMEAESSLNDSFLIMAMPTTPIRRGDKKAPNDLPGVMRETEELIKAAKGIHETVVLTHPCAQQVLDRLETCRIAHFACHGTSDRVDPSNSGLILQKGGHEPGSTPEQDHLTMHAVSELRLKGTQIAYLSACSTAENKATRLSDEVIHVVSGFQVAGFPHVIGCLWPAGDSDCVEVARKFYSRVLQRSEPTLGSRSVALALQEAVMEVRAKQVRMPLNWAQFVHYGA